MKGLGAVLSQRLWFSALSGLFSIGLVPTLSVANVPPRSQRRSTHQCTLQQRIVALFRVEPTALYASTFGKQHAGAFVKPKGMTLNSNSP